MLSALAPLSRYIVCGRVTKRPIFEFISPKIHPNDALMVFPFEDDYSFGILQSSAHWIWFVQRCSTMKGDYRYTSNTVFDTFPWPQSPAAKSVRAFSVAYLSTVVMPTTDNTAPYGVTTPIVRIFSSCGAEITGSGCSIRRSSRSLGTTPTPFIVLELIGSVR